MPVVIGNLPIMRQRRMASMTGARPMVRMVQWCVCGPLSVLHGTGTLHHGHRHHCLTLCSPPHHPPGLQYMDGALARSCT